MDVPYLAWRLRNDPDWREPPGTPGPEVRHFANQFVFRLAGNALVSGLRG